jgi:orotidine-5'-phosphate decarboxylase
MMWMGKMSRINLSPVIVALDFADAQSTYRLLDQLDPLQCRVKVGKQLFVKEGPALLTQIKQRGFEVFLDLKFYDIPNQVAGAVQSAAEIGVWMLTVHASGGIAMLTAAKKAAEAFGKTAPLLVAVTLLTSFSLEDIQEIGYRWDNTEAGVLHLASLAQQAGLDGVVASAQEARVLRDKFGKQFVLVTPGIRPADASVQDQKRVMTPQAALDAGSHYLVIGRPITGAVNPALALKAILDDLL